MFSLVCSRVSKIQPEARELMAIKATHELAIPDFNSYSLVYSNQPLPLCLLVVVNILVTLTHQLEIIPHFPPNTWCFLYPIKKTFHRWDRISPTEELSYVYNLTKQVCHVKKTLFRAWETGKQMDTQIYSRYIHLTLRCEKNTKGSSSGAASKKGKLHPGLFCPADTGRVLKLVAAATGFTKVIHRIYQFSRK